MKTVVKTSKKLLSAFMAIVMIVTAWVFVVPASAIELKDEAICPYDNGEHHMKATDDKKEATCTEDGYVKYICEKNDCSGVVYVREAKVPHEYYAEPYTVQATCTEKGVTVKVCKNCGHIETELTAPKGHTFSEEGTPIAPTCEEPGGVKYVCTVPGCEGYKIDGTMNPKGHFWGAKEIVDHPSIGSTFAMGQKCTRFGCDAITYEKADGSTTSNGKDENINKYYKVIFYNDFVTNKTEKASDGTMLPAEEDGYKSVAVATMFVREGEDATYVGAAPKRGATKDYGAYTFDGWTIDGDEKLAGSTVSNVTCETVVHAVFAGVDDVEHTVTFYNYDNGIVMGVQTVKHGEAAIYPDTIPSRDNDNFMSYELDSEKRWTYSEEELSHVYSSKVVVANYIAKPLKYKVVFHDYDGFVFDTEEIGFGEMSKVARDINPDRQADETNIYVFSGIWKTKDGMIVDMYNFVPPSYDYAKHPYNSELEDNEELSDAKKGIVHVYADYYNKLKIYEIPVYVQDSTGDPAVNATVQAVNSKGSLAGVATTDAAGVAILKVPYDAAYLISVACDGEVAENINLTVDMAGISVKLEAKYENGKCTCISHMPVIGRIYITFLNIIYSITGRKIVCCPDMYASHGKDLIYGPKV